MLGCDVAEFGTARAVLGRPFDGRRRPHVVLAVRGCLEHFHRVGSPELRLRIIRDFRHDRLAGDRIGHENHAALVASDHHAAVGYVGDLQLHELAQLIAHAHSLGAAVSGQAALLYLASTSPARLATLRAAGIEPVVVPSGVDEDAVVAAAGPLMATELVELLARVKAEAITSGDVDGFILGGDSVFELDGAIYGKPHTALVARERWNLQRGRTGTLHSGHWLIDHRGGEIRGSAGAVSSARVSFADDIADAELDAYIATGEPLHVAGAFTIDSLGAPFITSVEGDPHAVVGLSLATLRRLFLQFDVPWHSVTTWRGVA
ncbi:MAG: septum formation protein Maf [Cryobacterium sp.]|nr:septum formation protein Maf [Cryobacterium sp.]